MLAKTQHQSESRVSQIRSAIKSDWLHSDYYDLVESEAYLGIFWDPGVFRDKFDRLDLGHVAELACGHGRHAAQLVDRAGRLTLVDINRSNIEFCRERFTGSDMVSFVVNDGTSLDAIADGSLTALFCYDAMVHFEATDVIAYLGEIARTLECGGRALLHYSNTEGYPEGTYADAPHWRNFFTEPMMRHFANRAGFRVLDSETMTWPPGQTEAALIDAVTLLEKI